MSSKEQEREGFKIPAQQRMLNAYADDRGLTVVREFIDVETAKRAGRTSFTKMLAWLKQNRDTCRTILVEKTDRLYRNLKDWVVPDELDLEIHLVKEGIVLSDDARSTDKFMHGHPPDPAQPHLHGRVRLGGRGLPGHPHAHRHPRAVGPRAGRHRRPLPRPARHRARWGVHLPGPRHLRPLRVPALCADPEGAVHLLPLLRLQGELRRAQYAWTCASKFRRTTPPERRNYNDDGNIWWSPVATEWSELGVGAHRVRRVAVSGVWHAVTGPPSKPWSLYDLITARSSGIPVDPTLRDAPVDLNAAKLAA